MARNLSPLGRCKLKTTVRYYHMLIAIVQSFSRSVVSDSASPWAVARQAPLSMGLPRQEYWSRLPFPSLGDLPDPGIKPASLVSPALAGGYFATSTTWEAPSKG